MQALALSDSSPLPQRSTDAVAHAPAVVIHARRGAGVTFLRGMALFLGLFTLANVAGALVVPTFDANIWWIDLRPLTRHAESPLLAVIGAALIGFAVRPAMSRRRRIATLAVVAVAALAALVNTVGYYQLRIDGEITGGFPIPVSLMVTAGLAAVALTLRRATTHIPNGRIAAVIGIAVCVALVFPLIEIACFGYTDYRRPSDAVVVLGAQAYPDGTPSAPLAERVRTACELYHEGLAPVLIMSGGQGSGAVHETEAMQRLAIALGVPASAILLDRGGINTRQTVEGTVPIFRRLGARRVMVVSQCYHLPRIKMAYQRAGWNVFTVPAGTTPEGSTNAANFIREIAAMWAYYVAPPGGEIGERK